MIKVLFAASEAHPLIKTGGLADVSGALPIALKALNCTVKLIIPAYPQVLQKLGKVRSVAQFHQPGIPGKINLLEGTLPGTKIKVYAVDYAPAFNRDGGPYLDNKGEPWEDNAERFALFAKAICKVALNQLALGWQPDVIHCNDWQTALVPALLKTSVTQTLSGGITSTPKIPVTIPATVFTIHNLAYQGLFSYEQFLTLGLPNQLWSLSGLEFHNKLSFIKGGLVFADKITTVSPQYALEIQTSKFGCGLEGLLKFRQTDLSGILNGIDENVWNPATDPYIAAHYDQHNIDNKVVNKQALQQAFGLAPSKSHLLLGFIGRLVEQKGIDLILQIIPNLTHLPLQIVILGTGEAKYEQQLKDFALKYGDFLKVEIGYDEAMAHKIEAGVDAFLMPSKFEPCGLNQLYSLRYGTLPIVHHVGGLADTVVDTTVDTLASHQATGIVFSSPTPAALLEAVMRTLTLYKSPESWREVITNGIRKNFKWSDSANQYCKLYRSILGNI